MGTLIRNCTGGRFIDDIMDIPVGTTTLTLTDAYRAKVLTVNYDALAITTSGLRDGFFCTIKRAVPGCATVIIDTVEYNTDTDIVISVTAGATEIAGELEPQEQ